MFDWFDMNKFLYGNPGGDADFEAAARLGGLNNAYNSLQPTGGLLGRTLEDGTKLNGWGMPAFNAVTGLGNLWMGMKNYGLAKDSLKEGRRQFDMNWGMNRDMVNSQLEDRQRARVASNPGAYQPVDEYMSTYRVR